MVPKTTLSGYLISVRPEGENGALALVLTPSSLVFLYHSFGNRVKGRSFPLASQIGSLTTFECNGTKGDLLRISSYKTQAYFGDFAKDLKTSSFFMVMNEIVEKFLMDSSTKMFSTYSFVTEKLKKDGASYSLLLFFLVKLMGDLGVEPNITNCVSCGSLKNLVSFSFREGGFLCIHCFAQKGTPKMPRQELLTYRYLFSDKMDFKDLTKIPIGLLKRITLEIMDYLEDYFSVSILNKELFIQAML